LAVYDSGSTGLTGSMLWDSERDHWVYSNPSGSSYSGGMLMSGPRASSLGNEQGTLNNFVMKGQGGDHITSSQIIDDGTTVRIPGNLQVTGSVVITSALTGSSATFSSNVSIGGNATVQSGNVLSIFRTDNTRAIQLYTTSDECVINSWEASSEPLHIRSMGSGGRIQFFTSGSEKMRITSAGNVGIGTTDLGPDGLSLTPTFNYSWSEGSGNAYAVLFRQRNSAATVMASGYKRSNTGGFASSYGISMARAAIAVGSNNGSIAFFSDTATNVANGTDITPTERMTILNNGNVGIGTSSPSVVFNVSDPDHGIGIAYRGSSALPSIAGLFTDTGVSGGTGYGDLLVKARTDFGGFYGINFYTSATNNTPVLRMRVQSDGVLSLLSGQLKFPATQIPSSDPNTLDDYEEGSFTPTLTIGGSSTGITYVVRRGDYTKVGRLVTIQLGIKMTSIGSNTGNLAITGLPFGVLSDSYYHPYGVVGVVLNQSLLPLYALGAGSEINFRKANTTSDVSPTNSDIDDDTYIFVTMTYSAS
jgi:hypothetical protein